MTDAERIDALEIEVAKLRGALSVITEQLPEHLKAILGVGNVRQLEITKLEDRVAQLEAHANQYPR